MKKFFFGAAFLSTLLIVIFYATDQAKFMEYVKKIKELLKYQMAGKQYSINNKFFMFQTLPDAKYANFLHSQRRIADFKKFIANLYKNKAFYLLPKGSKFYIIKKSEGFYNINVTFKNKKQSEGWIPTIRVNDYIDGKIEEKDEKKDKKDSKDNKTNSQTNQGGAPPKGSNVGPPANSNTGPPTGAGDVPSG